MLLDSVSVGASTKTNGRRTCGGYDIDNPDQTDKYSIQNQGEDGYIERGMNLY